VRVRGWFHVIQLGGAQDSQLRYRHVAAAQLGGCGWNAVLPARAGDAVKVALVHRRTPEMPLAALAGTLVPPALVDAALTAMLVAALVAAGALVPSDLAPQLPGASALLIGAGVGCVVLVVAISQRRRLRRIAAEARAGLAAMGRPRFILTRVAPWHLAARGLKLLSLACVLMAAGIPFGLGPALLLLALQGASASPSPTATAVRVALMAGLLAGAGGVEPAEIATVLMTAYAATSAANLVASSAVIALELRTVSPRRVLSYARAAISTVGRAAPAGSA
jgi:Lysylphosphatidylglycerol synthase TM region